MNYTKRKLEVVHRLLNSGIVDFANKLISSKIRYGRSTIEPEEEIEYAKKLRTSLEQLGPVFIKFGQLLSSRRDIFSKNIISELEKLQDDVAPLKYTEVKNTITKEFGKDPQKLFVSFDENPLASGSIAQTHRAKIKDGGQITEVCVKVLRENIEETIDQDTKIMLDLARKYSFKLKEIKTFDLVDTIEEFRKSLFKEIDFNIEKNNLIKFYELNKKDKYMHSPKVFEKYCRKKVLTMEFIDGESIRVLETYSQEEKREFSKKLVHSYVDQCFINGFFQADPHPGNIMIKDKEEIYLLDFGIVGSLSENYRYQILKIFVGASYNEVKIISDALICMGLFNEFSKINQFERRLQNMLDNYLAVSLHEIKISNMVEDFFDLLIDFDIKIPPDLTIFGKTIFSLEGLVAGLVTDQSFIELAYPIARSMLIKILKADMVLKRLIPKAYELFTLTRDFPKSSLSTIRQLASGSFSLNLEKSREELKQMERLENRKIYSRLFLGFSIILSMTLLAIAIRGIEINKIKFILNFLLAFSLLGIFVILFKILRQKEGKK